MFAVKGSTNESRHRHDSRNKIINMDKTRHFSGLTDQQVTESRAKYGSNLLTPPEKEPLWRQFLKKFSDPLIIILIVAGVLSVGISCYEYWGLDEGKGYSSNLSVSS